MATAAQSPAMENWLNGVGMTRLRIPRPKMTVARPGVNSQEKNTLVESRPAEPPTDYTSDAEDFLPSSSAQINERKTDGRS